MSITRIDINQPLFNLHNSAGPQVKKTADTVKTTGTDTSSHKLSRTENMQEFVGIQSVNEEVNRTAMSVRKADGSMMEIHDFIAAIKSQLDTIVKNYPPFPPGSEERVRALKSFAGFRKQIDQLTIPPLDQGAAKIMADPARVPGAGKLEVSAGDTIRELKGQPVHTGASGLDIPALPENATDKDIAAVVEKLDKAQQTLTARRSELAQDALSVIQDIKRMSDIKEPELSEPAAELKSSEVRDLLATDAQGLTLKQQVIAVLV